MLVNMRGAGLKLHQGRLRLDIRENVLTEGVVKLEPSLEVLQTHVDGALRALRLSGDRGLLLHSVISEVFPNFHTPPVTL